MAGARAERTVEEVGRRCCLTGRTFDSDTHTRRHSGVSIYRIRRQFLRSHVHMGRRQAAEIPRNTHAPGTHTCATTFGPNNRVVVVVVCMKRRPALFNTAKSTRRHDCVRVYTCRIGSNGCRVAATRTEGTAFERRFLRATRLAKRPSKWHVYGKCPALQTYAVYE